MVARETRNWKFTLFVGICVLVACITALLGQSVYRFNMIRMDTTMIQNTTALNTPSGVIGSLKSLGNTLLKKLSDPQNNFNNNVTTTTTTTTRAPVPQKTGSRLKIAILIPSTSRKIPKEQFFTKSSLVTLTIPAILKTIETSKYDYFIYLGMDKGDYMETLQPQLKNVTQLLIPVVVESTNFAQCANGIAKRAFDDGMDYFVRINDDSVLTTEGWTTIGINKLLSYKPPNVGVVGPTCNQGNTVIMTHDMVHRSHLQIFSHYYPVEFRDWWIDDWITIVYRPTRSTKLSNWVVVHKMTQGQRYKVIMNAQYRLKLIDTRDKPQIMGFIYPKRQVISYSLFGSDSKYTDGALANAELMKTIYPDWVMRIYHDKAVPAAVLGTLSNYEYVHLILMPKDAKHKLMWRYLVASDPQVNVYIIRNIDARLSAREKSAVDKWLETDKQFHVMRDHPEQSNTPLNGGLWGGRKGAINNIGQMMAEIDLEANKDEVGYFMEYVLWPIIQKSVVQHDSFSCKKYGPAMPFPTARKDMEFVGSKHVAGKVDNKSIDALKQAKECT